MNYRNAFLKIIFILCVYGSNAKFNVSQNKSNPIELIILSKSKEIYFKTGLDSGGFKVTFFDSLKSAVEKLISLSDHDKDLVLFVKSESVHILGSSEEIYQQFKSTNSTVLLSSSESLNALAGYPLSILKFISKINACENIFAINKCECEIFQDVKYSQFFREAESRRVKVDQRSQIFQNIFKNLRSTIGSCQFSSKFWKLEKPTFRLGYLEILPFSNPETAQLFNSLHNTEPLIILLESTDLESRSVINFFGNYLTGCWKTSKDISYPCEKTQIFTQDWPTILLAIFITRPIPFLDRFLSKVSQLEYPKDKIHVVLYNSSWYIGNSLDVKHFIDNYSLSYASFETIQNSNGRTWEMRKQALAMAQLKNVSYYFHLHAEAHLDSPNVLKYLVKQNVSGIVSPLLHIPYRTSSNFWGDVDVFGKKYKSKNYLPVVHREHLGHWRVPCLSLAYLVDMNLIRNNMFQFNYTKSNDGIYCIQQDEDSSALVQWPFVLTNFENMGHRVTGNFFLTEKIHPELYQLPYNRFDWELSYLHPDWSKAITEKLEEPCPDVFWFPLVNERFCKELIQTVEEYGNWNEGINYTPKENETAHPNPDPVPTVDVDLEDIKYDMHWLKVVENYVLPLRNRVFDGLVLNPPFIPTTTLIRYRPEEQSSNKPHHDTSTYTVNLALNRPHVDFEGGGCRFIRHNCSVTESRVGWFLIHPGDLTHYHEGLSTTKGTRYILVSFIDPRMKDMPDHPLWFMK